MKKIRIRHQFIAALALGVALIITVAASAAELSDKDKQFLSAYEKARAGRGAATSAPELFSAIETDRIFRIPGVRLAERQAKLNPQVFNYLFTWPSPAMGGMLGSCHALELGFVFGTNHLPGMSAFSGTGPAADKLAQEMQDAWLRFARSGDPGWPAYNESSRATMIFDEKSGAKDAPYDAERRAWEAVPDRVLGAL